MRFTSTIERIVSIGGRCLIPVFALSDSFNVFNVFIVYTYTEESEEMGQSLLNSWSQRSLWYINTITFSYHGTKDVKFLDWWRSQDYTIHKHKPNRFEDMEHQVDYIGTWHRIDILLFRITLFWLFLDSDTIVHDRFTSKDFGVQMTSWLAAGTDANDKQ